MSANARRDADASSVSALITLVACASTALLVMTAGGALEAIGEARATFAAFALLTLVLASMSVEVYGRGSMSVGGIGILATGFTFGVGAAIIVGLGIALLHFARERGKPIRAIFNASMLALSGAAGAAAYQLVAGGGGTAARVTGAVAAGIAAWALNIGLLTLVMSISERLGFVEVWRERFRWLTAHQLAFGPLALACTVAYERIGFTGLVAFGLPPTLLTLAMHQYLARTKEAVHEAREVNAQLSAVNEQLSTVNEQLSVANRELGSRNTDLRELFEFAGGLAARSHDRSELVAFAEAWIGRVTRGQARIRVGPGSGGEPLTTGGHQVGSLSLIDDGRLDHERWERLRATVLPQLATAIESVDLVDRVRKTHLATIAALSRSMEAKDLYTGGHTERVAEIAVALGRRLGYSGAELEAIEIGALLHDIGKIGVPEQILRKPAPLDESEWEVMKQHPLTSDYILSEIDLPPIVRQIARSSHERIDGTGYPDRLSGEEIPLPARIALVADAWDAVTSDRPYRSGRDIRAALEELRKNAGTQFCTQVVTALEQLYREEPHVLTGGQLHAVQSVA